MSRYTYLASNLLTGAIRDEIPFSSVAFSDECSKASGFDGTVTLETPTLTALTGQTVPNRVTLSTLQPASTGLWVLRDGVPLWGGILWGFTADLSRGTLRVSGQDFFSYYSRRRIGQTMSWTSKDQFTIFEDIIDYCQAVGGGDIGTVVSYTALSGVERDRTYLANEQHNVAEALTQLAQVDNGFDFSVDYTGSQASGLGHTLTLSYPRRGRNTGVIFDTAKNVQLLNWKQDGLRIANSLTAVGSGDADNQLLAPTSDPGLLVSYPLLEDVTVYSDVTVMSTLIDHAAQDLRARRTSVEEIEIEVRVDDLDGALGTIVTGDTVRMRASHGFIQLDQLMRVMSRRVSIDENGHETMSCTLAGLEATT